MLSTALPTARSNSPPNGNRGVERRSHRDRRLWRNTHIHTLENMYISQHAHLHVDHTYRSTAYKITALSLSHTKNDHKTKAYEQNLTHTHRPWP